MISNQKKRVYLDYQASTPIDPIVLQEMLPYFTDTFGNPHASEHFFGWESMKAVEQARNKIAHAIQADADEIVFTSGATESNNLALLGVAKANTTKRKKILISAIEHKCILNAAASLKDEGYDVITVPVNKYGLLEPSVLEHYIDNNVLLVSVMSVNNEIGTIQKISKISEICHSAGALFHTDASQALPAITIDVIADQIDLLSLSSHKIYGPKGIGALYISHSAKKLIKPILFGGGQEDGLRSGTIPTPLCVGFGKASELMYSNSKTECLQIKNLRDAFFQAIKKNMPDIQLNGPELDNRHPGNLNICFPGQDAKSMLQSLQPFIAASTGSACTSGIEEPSYVLRGIGLTNEEAQASIRFSFGRFTTADEISFAVDVIKDKAIVV